jgi:hypothetical protein
VLTNVDLSRVRFNQVQYNRKDIEETVLVPPCDRLIVDTYVKHVNGRKAVAFCVNIRHGEALAERVYHYFSRERIDEVRETLGLPKVEPHNIKDLFLRYADDNMDMSASYKPVLLLTMLDFVDSHGRASLANVVGKFRRFYEERKRGGLVVEGANTRMAKVDELADADVQRVMLEMPFEKFERRRYLKYDRDLAFVRFEPNLWRQLRADDLAKLRAICEARVKEYYERLEDGSP